MTNELALVMLLSRSEFDIYNKRRIAHLLKAEINWYKLFNIAIEKKTIYIVYKNLHILNYIFLVPCAISNYCLTAYQGNIARNHHLIKMKEMLLKKFLEQKVPLYPIRGIMLLQNVYEDIAMRFLSDIDFLIPQNFIEQSRDIMLEAGARVLYRDDSDIYFNSSFNYCKSLFYGKSQNNGIHLLDTFDFSFGFPCEENSEILMDFFTRCLSDNCKSGMYYIAQYLILCIGYYESMNAKKSSKKIEDMDISKLIDIDRFYTKFVANINPVTLKNIITQLQLENCINYVQYCLAILFERKI